MLEVSSDSVTFQREWSIYTGIRENGFLMILALFAGNIGPGLFMISVFAGIFGDYYYTGFVVSFLIVLLGYGLPHTLFLGRKIRFWRALAKPKSSWISRGFIFATMFLFFSFLTGAYFYISTIYKLPDITSPLYYILPICGFLSAFLLSLYPGFVFSSVRAIAFWNSFLIVPLFVIQSFGAGIALAFTISHASGNLVRGIDKILPFEAVIIIISAILIAIYLYNRYRAGNAGRDSVNQLLRGRYSKLFLFGALLCEIIIPLVFVLLAYLGTNQILLVIAESIQLFGIFVFKFCFIQAGAYNSLIGDKQALRISDMKNRSS